MRGLRRHLAAALHRWRGWRGNVDGVIDGALTGWVALTDPAAGPQPVGLFTARGQIASTTANLQRDDLRDAGIGDGRHGFAFPLDAATLQVIAGCGNRVSLRLLGPRPAELGRWNLQGGRLRSLPHGPAAAPAQSLEQLLHGPAQRLWLLLGQLRTEPPAAAAAPPRLARHGRMLAPRDLVADGRLEGRRLPATMTAYADYVRYRYRKDRIFDLSGSAGIEVGAEARTGAETGVGIGAEHYLHWYVAAYSPGRPGLRVPLSAAQIAHLNAPVLIGGQPQSLSRATWMYLSLAPPSLQGPGFGSDAWAGAVIYWWAAHQARALQVEDCLVPPDYLRRLARIPAGFEGLAWAPSEFMLQLRRETPALAALDPAREEDRRQLALAVLLLAVQRPDYLRYLPPESVEALLAPAAFPGSVPAGTGGDTPLGGFAARIAAGAPDAGRAAGGDRPGLSPAPATFAGPLTRQDYAAVLRRSGFDLDRRAFLAFTPEGHRFEAAMLPVPQGPAADVQVIGPFEKASGLGQATRLSAAALAAAGFAPNCVDFDLDNPAPEGFSRVGALNGYRPARVNLIHLNAESIPLAFAYQPDVFSGAWNIGFFFWELDSPAACHHLAFELLDEIWVSTRYGVRIYRPHSRLPVTNVGMCYEEPPEIPRPEARAFLARRCGVRDEFTFLVAFDSFSFVQRKNPLAPIRAFQQAFPQDRDVRLILKTQNRRKVGDPPQVAIWEQIDAFTRDDPRITVLDETLSYHDLLRLKKGCDAYVSLHRSEGWGFGMIEAMALGVPVVATGYSGNMEFCSDETAFLVDYEEVELAPDDYIFVRPGQKWAEPDVAHAARQMRAVREDAALREARAGAALRNVRENFSATAIGRRYKARLDEILARQGLTG